MSDHHLQVVSRSLLRLAVVVLSLASLWVQPTLGQEQNTVADSAMAHLLTRERSDACKEYGYNATKLIPGLYENGRRDSIDAILDFIDRNCGSAQFRTVRSLLSISDGTFDESQCDTAIMHSLLDRYWGWDSFDRLFRRSTIYDWIYSDTLYPSFVRNLAGRIARQTSPNSMSELTALYYSGNRDSILSRLRSGGFAGTCAKAKYDAMTDTLLGEWQRFRSDVSFNLGVWTPQGAANRLGTKVEVGGQAGIRYGRWGGDLTVLLRFLDAPEPYYVRQKGNIVSTTHFIGGYIGIDPAFQILSAGRFYTELFCGIGYDGIEAVGDEEDGGHVGIDALNLNIGLTQRFFVDKKRSRFFGVQIRQNFVKYATDGGSDLSGNTLSINLVAGYMGNSSANWALRRLQYYDQ